MKMQLIAAVLLCAAGMGARADAEAPKSAAPAAAAVADGAAATNAVKAARPTRKLTREEAKARHEKMMMRRYGGVVRKAGSAHGRFVFVNAQSRVGDADFKRVMEVIDEKIFLTCEYAKATVAKPWNPSGEIKSLKADMAVVVVDSDDVPALLTAPEARWAVVNVRPLADGCDGEALSHRVRVEMLRAFALIGGAAFMQMDPVVMMGNVLSAKDLDMIREEGFGVDVAYAISKRLPELGVTPWKETTYKRACEEGWAPAPTNDFQKAIWDKVHAIPTEPLKIKYQKPDQSPNTGK